MVWSERRTPGGWMEWVSYIFDGDDCRVFTVEEWAPLGAELW